MFDNFTFQASAFDAVPEGNFSAEYIGNEEIASKFGEDGKAIAWRFKIVDGPQSGKVVSHVTGMTATAKNKCGKMLVAMLGRTPGVGENINVKDCVGKRYLVVVTKNDKGDGTKVENVVRLP